MTGRKPRALRYYLYVSDTKLDMLFEQIDPGQRRKISAEVKVDLKLASVTLRSIEHPAPARAAKLRVVERYIERNHRVGSVGVAGAEYVRGSMPMRWGRIPSPRSLEGPPGLRLPMVFFKGEMGDQVVMLAGSRHHLLGEYASVGSAAITSGSDLSAIVSTVANQVHTFGTAEHQPLGHRVNRPYPGGGPNSWLELIDRTFEGLNAEQHLEFLAVPLLQGPMLRAESLPLGLLRYGDYFPEGEHPLRSRWVPGRYRALLATPLYVALASPPGSV